ncbi:hypothetical protein ASD92_09885 [Massilia sp. Root1485]|nr:hypothetical protein ASD92_09885 [Massilia sp. Root1485]
MLAAQEKRIPVEEFIRQLVASNIALPSAVEVQENGSGFQPIIFDKLGTKMLAIFTDKARVTQLEHIAKYCLVMNALEMLRRIPSGYGIVINPGLNVGLELSPDGIAEIVKDFTPS